MANPEHVKIVKQGAEAIAEWRRKNPKVKLDLSVADLRGANLIRADLRVADLRVADLSEADLSGANLSGANLTLANLTLADLSVADLSGANLSEADLSGANLIRADLSVADLSGATVGFTTFADCDLREVKSLETVVHHHPSSIGIDTIIRSEGKIPPQFLEGAGVPETWIYFVDSLITAKVIEFYSAFLSHSHHNQEFADKLYGSLKEKKIRVWYFPADARGGRYVESEITQAIKYYNKVMVICSKEALASKEVLDEIEQAAKKQEETNQWTLFPIAIDDEVYNQDSKIARTLRHHVIEDFRMWRKPSEYQKALEKLVRDLAAKERPAG